MLREYLYVDQPRLDQYAEQIFPSGVVIEKNREWSVGLGLTGPNAGAKQSERTRPMTTQEKIDLVLQHLTQSAELKNGRPVEHPEDSEFVLEQCDAARVLVPRPVDSKPDRPAFAFWLAPVSGRVTIGEPVQNRLPSILCLLEDYSESGGLVSKHSLLGTLINQSRGNLWNFERPSLWPPGFDFPEGYNDRHLSQFLVNPADMLKAWGCSISPPRHIQSLYRIRSFGTESIPGRDDDVRTIVAYPIWIRVTP